MRPFLEQSLENDPTQTEKAARARRGENERFGQWVESGKAPERRFRRALAELAEEVSEAIDCTRCANCCKRLWPVVTGEDIARLAARLGVTEAEFRDRYVRELEGDECIVGGPCPFLDGNLCSVYEDRPDVCRRYPCVDEGCLPPTATLIEEVAVCPITFHVVEGLKRRFEGWGRRQ